VLGLGGRAHVCGCRRLKVERRVVNEDRSFELLEGVAGLDPELVDKRCAKLAVRLERLGLPARAERASICCARRRSRSGWSHTSDSSSATSKACRPIARSASIRRSSAARRISSSRVIVLSGRTTRRRGRQAVRHATRQAPRAGGETRAAPRRAPVRRPPVRRVARTSSGRAARRDVDDVAGCSRLDSGGCA
jgi:hypothetical protein